MRLAATILAIAALGWPGGAAAQAAGAPAAAAEQEPTSMMLQALCAPWLADADARQLATEAERRGFQAKWDGPKLTSFSTPKALFSQGWQTVALGEGRRSCALIILWVGTNPIDYLSTDIQNWLVDAKPTGIWEKKLEFWQDGEFGKATRVRAWNSATRLITLTETPDAQMTKEQGMPVVIITVTMEKTG